MLQRRCPLFHSSLMGADLHGKPHKDWNESQKSDPRCMAEPSIYLSCLTSPVHPMKESRGPSDVLSSLASGWIGIRGSAMK